MAAQPMSKPKTNRKPGNWASKCAAAATRQACAAAAAAAAADSYRSGSAAPARYILQPVWVAAKMGTRNHPASVWAAAKSWWDVLVKYPIQQNSVVVSSCGTGYLMSNQSVCRKGLILRISITCCCCAKRLLEELL